MSFIADLESIVDKLVIKREAKVAKSDLDESSIDSNAVQFEPNVIENAFESLNRADICDLGKDTSDSNDSFTGLLLCRSILLETNLDLRPLLQALNNPNGLASKLPRVLSTLNDDTSMFVFPDPRSAPISLPRSVTGISMSVVHDPLFAAKKLVQTTYNSSNFDDILRRQKMLWQEAVFSAFDQLENHRETFVLLVNDFLGTTSKEEKCPQILLRRSGVDNNDFCATLVGIAPSFLQRLDVMHVTTSEFGVISDYRSKQNRQMMSSMAIMEELQDGKAVFVRGRADVLLLLDGLLEQMFTVAGKLYYGDFPTIICPNEFSHSVKMTPRLDFVNNKLHFNSLTAVSDKSVAESNVLECSSVFSSKALTSIVRSLMALAVYETEIDNDSSHGNHDSVTKKRRVSADDTITREKIVKNRKVGSFVEAPLKTVLLSNVLKASKSNKTNAKALKNPFEITTVSIDTLDPFKLIRNTNQSQLQTKRDNNRNLIPMNKVSSKANDIAMPKWLEIQKSKSHSNKYFVIRMRSDLQDDRKTSAWKKLLFGVLLSEFNDNIQIVKGNVGTITEIRWSSGDFDWSQLDSNGEQQLVCLLRRDLFPRMEMKASSRKQPNDLDEDNSDDPKAVTVEATTSTVASSTTSSKTKAPASRLK